MIIARYMRRMVGVDDGDRDACPSACVLVPWIARANTSMTRASDVEAVMYTISQAPLKCSHLITECILIGRVDVSSWMETSALIFCIGYSLTQSVTRHHHEFIDNLRIWLWRPS